MRPSSAAVPTLALLGAGLVAAPAWGACEGAQIGGNQAVLPPEWSNALAALVGSTGAPGAPWACVGGVVWLELHGVAATLVVTPADGAEIRREVDEPDDVVPLGQALLAMPLEPSAPLVAAPPREDVSEPLRPPAARPAAVAEPRALVALVVGPRWAGKTDLLWGGAGLDAAIPFGAWTFGGWGRYDGVRFTSTDPPTDLDEIALGLSAGRNLYLDRVALRPSLRPSLALVSGSDGRVPSETRVFGRIGADLRLILPLGEGLRGVVALDGELAPGALGDGRSGDATNGNDGDVDRRVEPTYPSYTVGLGVGVELAVR